MFGEAFFGGLFDFDNNGELNNFERVADTVAFWQAVEESEEEDSEECMLDELEAAGVDIDGFEYMDENERYEAICEAGLDPDDYDF